MSARCPDLRVLMIPLVFSASALAQDDFGTDSQGDRLATAIDSGSVAAVRRVLDEGASPNTMLYGTPALTWTIWDNRYYVAKLLVDRGANVNLATESGHTPLMSACDIGNLRIVKLLLDHGADINAVEETYGMSALQCACTLGNEGIVDLLIARGANVEHVDKFDGNCLEEAAFYGHAKIVEMLRSKGLTTGWPLHVACGLGEVERVRTLLEQGAKADAPNDGWKNTPLHFAAGGGHVEVAKLLAERGVSLDARNVLGATPLHVCAGSDAVGLAIWLLNEGVDINAPDDDGSTPLDWAGEKVHELLNKQGAEHGDLDVAPTEE